MAISKRSFSFITNRPYWQLYILGIVVLILSAGLWYTRVYLSSERVFWGMVNNSLSTRGVTIEISQTNEQSSVKQLVQMELGSTNKAHSLTTLRQGNTEVKTEIIGTRDTDYTRYRSIDTDQKNAQGKSLDVSKVVGVWSKSDGTKQTETGASSNQLFSQVLLGIGLPVGSVPVPIGEVTAGQREDMVRQIRDNNVYEISFKDVKKERKDGRLRYTYEAKIQTILYVRMMKQFGENLGLTELSKVDPNSYQTTEPLNVKLTVDAVSRQLVSIENTQAQYKQTYSGYGLPLKVAIPKQTITAAELQKRLTEL